jgi:excinuclease UvrABC nuclease subunit
MKSNKLNPKPDNFVSFQLLDVRLIPQEPGCYSLTNFQNDIIYIGLAKNLQNRVLQHLENPEKNVITPNGKIFYVHYKVIENELLINQLERGWLNEYELEHEEFPPLNKIHSPIY